MTQHGARSYNHCCSRKGVSIIYSESMSVTLGNQHTMRVCHIVIRGLSGSIVFFHIIS